MKLLYLEDLYNFFVSQNKNVKFSSKDSDTTIVVHIDEPLTYSKTEDNDLILNTPIRLCHTEKNINKSYISEKAMKDAIPTAYNMPILGYIWKDSEDEEYKFAGHEFFINEDNEVEYEEVPVGCIPESAGLELVYDEDADKTYLDGNGIIWRTYSRAAEILEREKQLSCSVELVVDELSFDSKEKVLVIDKFRFSGVTILQADKETGEEIKPGMQGANISIADFSEKNNSVFSNNDKVIELLSALNEKIDNLNINESLKEGGNLDVKKEFEDEIEVAESEVEETSSETFEEEPKKKKKDVDDPVIIEDESDEDDKEDDDDKDDDDKKDDDQPKDEDESVVESQDEPEDESNSEEDNGEEANGEDESFYSVSVTRGEDTKTFSVSLQDKIEAIHVLVNDTYAEADGCYYDCTVYDEEKYVIMCSWWTGDAYKQSYKVKKDVYSLVGDRVRVKAVWCTEDEEKALENMRANYSSIEEKLAQYEAEPDKLAVLKDECYSQISETDAFKKLAERDTYFSMSVDEVRAEADRQLLEFAKHNTVEFSAKEEPKKTVGMRIFKNPTDKKSTGKSRYGGLFNK